MSTPLKRRRRCSPCNVAMQTYKKRFGEAWNSCPKLVTKDSVTSLVFGCGFGTLATLSKVAIFVMLSWAIWSRRNATLFHGVVRNEELLINSTVSMLEEFKACNPGVNIYFNSQKEQIRGENLPLRACSL